MSDILQKRDKALERWVRHFFETSNTEPELFRPGDMNGEWPQGVKILFESYSEGNDGHSDPYGELCFAVFIHKESPNGVFPEHEFAHGMILRRLDEELCFYVWYDLDEDEISVSPDCDFADTSMDQEEAQALFLALIRKLGPM